MINQANRRPGHAAYPSTIRSKPFAPVFTCEKEHNTTTCRHSNHDSRKKRKKAKKKKQKFPREACSSLLRPLDFTQGGLLSFFSAHFSFLFLVLLAGRTRCSADSTFSRFYPILRPAARASSVFEHRRGLGQAKPGPELALFRMAGPLHLAGGPPRLALFRAIGPSCLGRQDPGNWLCFDRAVLRPILS